jgi:RNA polymerase sigma factor (sigma-70 family)
MHDKNDDLAGIEFIERNRMTMLRIARAELADKGDPDPDAHTEDVANDVSMTLLSKWAVLKSPVDAMYVYTVNRARTYARGRRREVASEIFEIDLPWLVSPGLDPEKELELAERIDVALSALNDKERAVIELRHFHGLSFDSIAIRLEAALGTVTSIHTRALRKMRHALESLDAAAAHPAGAAGPEGEGGASPLVVVPEI